MIIKHNTLHKDTVTLLNSMAEGVVVINSKSDIIFVNNRVQSLFGYSLEEIFGQKLDVLIPHNFKQQHNNHIEGFFHNPKVRPMGMGMELTASKKDGTEFFVEISLSFLNQNGENYGFAFISDITDRKKAEDQLKERNKELDSFAHTVAHDINSTLAGIVGFGELLVRFPYLPEEKKHIYYDRIVTSGRKMSSIIRELLFFASITKEEVIYGMVNTKKVIDEAIKRLDLKIKENKASITISETIDDVISYGPWIEEIWYNLISNAIKYGGQKPQIELSSRVVKNRVKYIVKDHGKGLTEEEIENIINDDLKFKRGKIKGHGLGLSIVNRILRKLDGHLEIESILGKGSTFIFSLPL